MQIGNREVSKAVLGVAAVVIIALIVAGVYFGTKGSSNNTTGTSASNTTPANTVTAPPLPPPATQAPTIATGKGAAGKVSGFKMSVLASSVPEIQSGKWVVSVAVQGGAKRSQTLGEKRLTPGQPFVVSNNSGAYTIAASILNCAKGCGPNASGYPLPPLTVQPKENVTVVITARCVKSSSPLGIDCRSSTESAPPGKK
jgi:hypothetical protein